MEIYVITISCVSDTHNITRVVTPTCYKTRKTAREDLAKFQELYDPLEGYILKVSQPDFFIFTVKTQGDNYDLTMAIETLITH